MQVSESGDLAVCHSGRVRVLLLNCGFPILWLVGVWVSVLTGLPAEELNLSGREVKASNSQKNCRKTPQEPIHQKFLAPCNFKEPEKQKSHDGSDLVVVDDTEDRSHDVEYDETPQKCKKHFSDSVGARSNDMH